MTFTEAAVLILRAEGKPLTWRKLAELAVRHELLSHVGTDPAETMRVRLADVVRRQAELSPFVEGKGGNYSLREWSGQSPGPSAAAAAELEARRIPSAAAVVPAPPPAARRRTRGSGPAEKRGRSKRGGSGAAPEERGRDAATEATAVTTTEPEDGTTAREAAQGAGTGAAAGGATAVAAPEQGRPGETRKRRRRGRRGRGGSVGPVAEQAPEAVTPGQTELPMAAPGPAVPSLPAPLTPSPAPPAAPSPQQQPTERGMRPPPPAATVACAPCDLGRAAESALRLLRSQGGRKPLRAAELLAQWAARGAPEGKLPPSALSTALVGADAAVRVGAPLVGLSGERWALAEWVWGDELATLERRIGEAVAQYMAAMRRAVLRRLADMPLPVFQQLVVALLAAEGFRDVRPVEDAGNGPGEQLLLRARMPFGPAEISILVLVVRGTPGRFVSDEQVAILRGRLPRTGACGGAIVTLGRVSDAARRDLVPPNAVPLLAIEHEGLAERLVSHRIGVRPRCLDLPALDPGALGIFGEP